MPSFSRASRPPSGEGEHAAGGHGPAVTACNQNTRNAITTQRKRQRTHDMHPCCRYTRERSRNAIINAKVTTRCAHYEARPKETIYMYMYIHIVRARRERKDVHKHATAATLNDAAEPTTESSAAQSRGAKCQSKAPADYRRGPRANPMQSIGQQIRRAAAAASALFLACVMQAQKCCSCATAAWRHARRLHNVFIARANTLCADFRLTHHSRLRADG